MPLREVDTIILQINVKGSLGDGENRTPGEAGPLYYSHGYRYKLVQALLWQPGLKRVIFKTPPIREGAKGREASQSHAKRPGESVVRNQ
jgi:hypothetical protein